jgi:Phage major capsid protein E
MNMSTSQVRVIDPILTNHSRGYTQTGLIGDLVLPIVDMATRAAKRIEFDRSAFRRYKTRRAPGTNISLVSFGYEGKPVQLSQHALGAVTPVEHQEEADAGPGIDLLTTNVDTVLAVIATEKEIQQASAVRNPAAYAATNKVALIGGAKWSDPASDPAKAISDAKEVIRSRTGRRPNTLPLGAKVSAALKLHPKVLEKFKYTNSNVISDQMLAAYFDVAEVLIGDAIYDDDAGNTMDVWGNDAILCFKPVGSNINIPSFGYTYRLRGYPMVKSAEYDRGINSYINDVFDEFSAEIVGPDAGFLFQNAV